MTAKNVLLVVMCVIGPVVHAASDDFNDNEGTGYTGWTEVGGTNLYSERNDRLEWNLGSNEIAHIIRDLEQTTWIFCTADAAKM